MIKYQIHFYDDRGKQTHMEYKCYKHGVTLNKLKRLEWEWRSGFKAYWDTQAPRQRPVIRKAVMALVYPVDKPYMMQRFELNRMSTPLVSIGPSGIGGRYQKEIPSDNQANPNP